MQVIQFLLSRKMDRPDRPSDSVGWAMMID
jgi:hypothetical protein